VANPVVPNTAALVTAGAVAPGRVTAVAYVAAPGRGDGAQDALTSVLGYLGAVVVETACRCVPVDPARVSPDGTISDTRFTAEAAQVWDALLDYLDER
jgi:chromate reductase, NAD(P)H dehydrogenase (quinone)